MYTAAPAPLIEGVCLDAMAGERREEDPVEVAVIAEAVDEDQGGFLRRGWRPGFRVEGVGIGEG